MPAPAACSATPAPRWKSLLPLPGSTNRRSGSAVEATSDCRAAGGVSSLNSTRSANLTRSIDAIGSCAVSRVPAANCSACGWLPQGVAPGPAPTVAPVTAAATLPSGFAGEVESRR